MGQYIATRENSLVRMKFSKEPRVADVGIRSAGQGCGDEFVRDGHRTVICPSCATMRA